MNAMKLFPSIVALCAALLLADVAPASETAFARRNPVVEAVQKTKSSIVCVRVPRPNGAKDMVGTGVVIDERGFIITNRHVVGSSAQVKIHLNDNTVLDGEVLLAEASWDLAVVRVRAGKKLTVLPLAPVDDLMVGETVIAIGHPFGYTNTVSLGIISALGREITMPTGEILSGLIQTNASINPGNSGGPLLNINGEFIGINVALREGAQNIAFAINAGTVKRFLKLHLSAVQVSGIQHGLECGEKTLAETGDRQRVVVTAFQGEGKDALCKGDEIIKVGACRIVSSFDVERAFWGRKAGDKVQMKINRQGQEMNVILTVAASDGAGHVTAELPQAAISPPSSPASVTTASVPAANQR
jgi:serine protease Do